MDQSELAVQFLDNFLDVDAHGLHLEFVAFRFELRN
jgi:hypothetical protein